MITGVWVSPDHTQIAVQFDEGEIRGMTTEYEGDVHLTEIPGDWIELTAAR